VDFGTDLGFNFLLPLSYIILSSGNLSDERMLLSNALFSLWLAEDERGIDIGLSLCMSSFLLDLLSLLLYFSFINYCDEF